MKNLRNRVQLIGRLGMDPELKTFEKGVQLVRMSIATDKSYKDNKGKKIDETQWHSVVAWGKTADIANKYLKKGQEVALEGSLVNRNYEDKEGVKRYTTEVHVSEFLMLGKKQD